MDGPSVDIAAKAFNYFNAIGLGWLWVFCLAVWGGTASYISRVRKAGLPFSFVELVGEWTISGFAGVITGYLCFAAGFPDYLTMAFAGVSGHMGGRAIALLESRVSQWLAPKVKADENRAD